MIALAVDLASMGGAGGGSAPFDPSKLSGLVAWYRADKGLSTTGAAVTAWADQSGIGDANRNLTQASAPNRPVFVAADATLGAQPSIQFNRLSETVLVPVGAWAVNLVSPCTIACALSFGAVPGDNFIYDDRVIAEACGLDINAGTHNLFVTPSSLTGGAVPTAAGCVSLVEINGASSTLAVSTLTPATTGTLPAMSSTGLAIGTTPGIPSLGFSGTCAEFVVYNRALGPADRASLLAYMGTRYGITIGP